MNKHYLKKCELCGYENKLSIFGIYTECEKCHFTLNSWTDDVMYIISDILYVMLVIGALSICLSVILDVILRNLFSITLIPSDIMPDYILYVIRTLIITWFILMMILLSYIFLMSLIIRFKTKDAMIQEAPAFRQE